MVGEIGFNQLNTRAPQEVAQSFDLIGAYNKGMDTGIARKNAKQTNEMNKLKLETAEQDQATKQAVKNALANSGGDMEKAVSAVALFDPKAAMDLRKQITSQQTAEVDQMVKVHNLRREASDMVAGADDSTILQTAISEAQRLSGLLGVPADAAVAHLNDLYNTQGAAGLRKEAQLQSLDAKSKLPKTQMVYAGDRVVPVEMNPLAEGYTGESIGVGMRPGEQERINISQQNANNAGQRTAMAAGTPGRDFAAEFAARGEIDLNRFRSKQQYQTFNNAAQYAEENGLVFDPMQAMKDTTYERALSASGGSRLVQGRKQNIEASQKLLNDIDTTATKLNYSDNKYFAEVEKWAKGVSQDPLFTEYMTQRADALFQLANALKQNGVTDKAIEVEEEANKPTLSPKALKAWLNVQKRALNAASEGLNESYQFGMKTVPTEEAGQGGAPKKSPTTVGRFQVEVE